MKKKNKANYLTTRNILGAATGITSALMVHWFKNLAVNFIQTHPAANAILSPILNIAEENPKLPIIFSSLGSFFLSKKLFNLAIDWNNAVKEKVKNEGLPSEKNITTRDIPLNDFNDLIKKKEIEYSEFCINLKIILDNFIQSCESNNEKLMYIGGELLFNINNKKKIETQINLYFRKNIDNDWIKYKCDFILADNYFKNIKTDNNIKKLLSDNNIKIDLKTILLK